MDFLFYISKQWNLNKNRRNITEVLRNDRSLYCKCDTELLPLVCWYIQLRIHDMEKNPSSNTCLISAGGSRTTEGWAGLMLWHNASHLLECPSPGSLFRCDRWHKQRILQSLCPSKIYEVSLFPRNQRAIHHENWRGGCLATVREAWGFWRLWCVHMKICKSS